MTWNLGVKCSQFTFIFLQNAWYSILEHLRPHFLHMRISLRNTICKITFTRWVRFIRVITYVFVTYYFPNVLFFLTILQGRDPCHLPESVSEIHKSWVRIRIRIKRCRSCITFVQCMFWVSKTVIYYHITF